MPSSLDLLTGGGKTGAKSSAEALGGGKKKKRTALEALVAGHDPTDMSAQIDEQGNPIASKLWETAKGAGRMAIDVLSRPNYAAAGVAEELLSPQGGGAGAAFERGISELLSGVGPIKGQKEGFSEVMEQAGVGELGKLSDLIPGIYSETGEGAALQRGGPLDPTARGTLGLGLDIFTDPTTYLTSGGSAVDKFLTAKGTRYLSDAGKAFRDTAYKAVEPAMKAARAIPEISERIGKMREIDNAVRDQVLQEIEKRPELLAKTGVKFMGEEFISPETLKGMTDFGKKVVTSVPVAGPLAAKSAEYLGRGIQRVFDPYADLAGLPPEMKDAMKGLLRENRSAAAAHKTVLLSEWDKAAKAYEKLAKTYGKGDAGRQALGKRFADWRQGTAAITPTPAEVPVFSALTKIYDEMEPVLLREGIIDPEQAAKHSGKYLHQVWKNADEALAETAEKKGRPLDRIVTNEQMQRARVFDTIQEGVDISKALHRETAGMRATGARNQVYGELIPEYDATKNLADYIQQSTDAIWRKKTYDEAAQRFGLPLDETFDPGRRYVLDAPRQVSKRDRQIIDSHLGDSKTIKELEQSFEFATRVAQTPELRVAHRRLNDVFESAPVKYYEKQTLKNLDEIRYYKRRGWDVVEEADDKYVAYKTNEVGTQEYSRWKARLNRAKAEVDAASGRAEREVRVGYNGWEQAVAEARGMMPSLTPAGRSELVRELVSRAKSPSQVVNIERAFGDALMPKLKMVKPGDIDPYYAALGQDGTLHTVKGGLWGEKPIQLPAQIIKMVENAPSDFIKDAFRKRGLEKLVQGYDKYNNLFKAMTYPFYPSGAVRDTYNNVMQAFLGVGVGAFARPFQAGRVLRGAADDVIRLGEREFTAKELNTLAKDLGVIDPSGAAYVQFTGEEGAKRSGLLSKARAKRGSVDNLTRSQLFINNIAAGMTPQDAAQVVKDFLFDYGELSAFDKDFMRRVMPFYVFPRKAIESYGSAAIKTPGRVINLAKPFRGREDENNAMTTWEGEGFKLRLDRNGKDITMLNGVDLPVRTMDMLWAGSPTKTMNRWLSMASPALKVPYEMLSGQDPFRGKALDRQQTYFLGPLLNEMPKPIQSWAGLQATKDEAGRPKYTVRMDRVQVLAEAALISRILSMGERQVREQAREPNNAARLLDFLTGLRLKTLNLDEEQAKKIENATRILQEEAVKQGDLQEFRKIYKRKGQ